LRKLKLLKFKSLDKIMKWSFSIFVLFTTFLVLSIVDKPLCAYCQEVSYAGKTVNSWVSDLNYKNSKNTRKQAQEAVRQIGTNSLAFLLAEMSALGESWEKDPTNFFKTPTLADRILDVRIAFEVLGPTAKPAIQKLVGFLNEGRPPGIAAYELTQIDADSAVIALTQALTNKIYGVRCAAASNLFYVRSNATIAVPNLIACLKVESFENLTVGPFDTDAAPLRNFAAAMLGEIHKRPEIAVPALIESLQNDSSINVRIRAAHALGKFGNDAQAAIPALTQAAKQADYRVSLEATSALKKILLQSP